MAKLLCERNADVNKRYFFGAEINLASDLESLELLLNFGANTEIRDRQGLTPLMRYSRQINGIEAVLLLLKYGADVNAMADGRNDFRTVLHYAILSGNYQTAFKCCYCLLRIFCGLSGISITFSEAAQ